MARPTVLPAVPHGQHRLAIRARRRCARSGQNDWRRPTSLLFGISRRVEWAFWQHSSSASGGDMPNSSIKNEKMYKELRKEGNSKQKSARISNAAAARGKST